MTKKLILIIFAGVIVINTVAGLLLSGYNLFNMALVDVLLVVSTGMFLYLSQAKTSVAYKIGLSWVLCFTGLIKVVLGLFSPAILKDNVILIVLLLITLVEIVLLSVVIIMRRHA